MKRKSLIILIALALSFEGYTGAYVVGYTILYRKNTDTIVDLVYDRHSPVPETTAGELALMGPTLATKRLFLSEQIFLSFIHKWERDQVDCDLIWETGGCEYWRHKFWCFLTMDSFFKLHTLKFVRFIPADRHRECGFVSLFEVYNGKTRLRPQNLTGCSFEDPAPLSPEIAHQIEQVSGTATWKEYKKVRKRVIKNLKDYFRPWYREKTELDFEDCFVKNSFFSTLCDIEMLSSLLSSKAHRIVVYAGAWHCLNIANFLIQNSFEILYSKCNPSLDVELSASDLAPLEHRKLLNPVSSSSSFGFLGSALSYFKSFLL